MTNFVIYSLPRSRSAWISNFLTYKDHTCLHEPAMTMRSPKDYYDLLKINNVGIADTGIAQGWRLVEYACPGIKTVVINRPVEDVVNSLMAVDLSGVATYERVSLTRHMEYGKRMLNQISARPGVLSLSFSDLNTLDGCKTLFEFCLPYEFDFDRWRHFSNLNIQIDMKKMLTYYFNSREDIANFKKLCKLELIKLRKEQPELPLWKEVRNG